MNNRFLKTNLLICIVFAALIGCDNSPETAAQKVENAKLNVAQAKNDLDQARIDSASEYKKYKEASDTRIKENETRIEKLKEDIKAERKENRELFQRRIVELDAQNEKLKARMHEFKEGSRDAWESFKTGFNHDMDALGKSISSISLQKRKKD